MLAGLVLLLHDLYKWFTAKDNDGTDNYFPESKIKVPMPPCKPTKDRIITEDEIRFNAYLIASADNFQRDPKEYWIEAENKIKGI